MRVLVSGAAGFIGSAVTDALRTAGHDLVAVDALLPQAHPAGAGPSGVDRVDVRDPDALRPLLRDVDVVVHQAAMVGAGTVTADLPLYAGHNDLGTATLLAAMSEAGVSRLVLASSMVVYGEGRYRCADHGRVVTPRPRDPDALAAGRFDLTCPTCRRMLEWEPVEEDARLEPRSSYAASKVAQEHYAGAWARQADAAVVALRYHNVYGPHMPRDTPYSGVAAIFRSALEGGRAPEVFEDGRQMRDFVHVRDVAAANLLATAAVAEAPAASFEAYNVCSGAPVSIGEVARILAAAAGGAEPVTSGRYRGSDVRHIVASPRAAADRLGFTAAVGPHDGLRAFVDEPLRATH